MVQVLLRVLGVHLGFQGLFSLLVLRGLFSLLGLRGCLGPEGLFVTRCHLGPQSLLGPLGIFSLVFQVISVGDFRSAVQPMVEEHIYIHTVHISTHAYIITYTCSIIYQ